jgi:hypothetical protein
MNYLKIKWINYKFSSVILLLGYFHIPKAFGQDTLSIGAIHYSYSYSEIYLNYSSAIGGTLLLHDEKFSIQIGILYDFEKKNYFEKVSLNRFERVETAIIHFPIIANYNLFSGEKANLFISGGFFIISNIAVSLGISYQVLPGYHVRVSPIVRYGKFGNFTESKFIPGLCVNLIKDIIVNFNK